MTVPLIRSTPLNKSGFSDPKLIRPPGSLEERDFLKRCVKCGECMKVCITNGLQPTLAEAGIEGYAFNMIGLFFFGPVLERVFGYKKFWIFYLLCGCGSGLVAVLFLFCPGPF
jgi:ferredoxin